MATATKICKVCGAEYPYCKTVFKPGTFRYQDVACCSEHGSIYLSKIEDSRKTHNEEYSNTSDNESQEVIDKIRKLVVFDEEFEDEYDDEDEEYED